MAARIADVGRVTVSLRRSMALDESVKSRTGQKITQLIAGRVDFSLHLKRNELFCLQFPQCEVRFIGQLP